MKAEINNENKAKFFALYWGQEILSDGNDIGTNVGDCDEKMFLLLKPLLSISGEDKEHAFWLSPYEKQVTHYVYNVDYLRLKGYALPWMGLSVEEMVKAGWIKLIKS
jgi:hypothetical protein